MASTIKVNNIQNQCGANIVNKCSTTITLGASGDNIVLAAGATQSGFGRTGTVDWDTTAKTGNFTAVSGNGYFVNTTSGAITVTLPAGSAGAIVSLADYTNTWQTNAVTVTPNGSEKINGGVGSVNLSTEGQSLTLVYVDATEGWKSVQDSTTSPVGNNFIAATGGTVTCCGDYKIHTFTGPGTFTVTSAGAPTGSDTVDYLVVAGGGAGGANIAGGGGGGGFRMASALPVTTQGYPITVGGGGTNPNANDTTRGGDGSNSVFSTITSTGGGGGGTYAPNSCASAGTGSPGGSGGGGTTGQGRPAGIGSGGTGNTPPTSPPQGNNGGSGASPVFTAGGGGGASAVGETAPVTCGGDGGAGSPAVPIFGSAPQPFYQANVPGAGNTACGTFAGGGGGGTGACATLTGDGGLGGGGRGAKYPSAIISVAGTTNSGGGGGGGDSYPGPPGGSGGAAGGSGIVIIRYKYQ